MTVALPLGLTLDLRPGYGVRFDEPDGDRRVPTLGGLYVVVHWPTMIVTAGETAQSIRARFRERRGWAIRRHRKWLTGEPQPRQGGDDPFLVVLAADEYGEHGWELFVVSTDERFQHGQPGGCDARHAYERFLFEWLEREAHTSGLKACNRQRGWRRCNGCPPRSSLPSLQRPLR
jgi:hypothetical protein